jgi:hypothetical protein
MDLRPRADGWLDADRGAVEFAIRLPANPGQPIDVDLGAGRILPFRSLPERGALPNDVAGTYRSADTGATWLVDNAQIVASGPYVANAAPWPLKGVTGDVVEIVMAMGWLTVTQLARLDRDSSGKVKGLTVSTSRIKTMKFEKAVES